MSDLDKKAAPPPGASVLKKDDFAEEFPPDSPPMARYHVEGGSKEKGQSGSSSARASVASKPVPPEHTSDNPVAAYAASRSDIRTQDNTDAIPGAMLITQFGNIATQRTLTESRRVVVMNEEFKSEEGQAPAVLDDSGAAERHNHRDDYFIAEANAVHQEDIAIAQVTPQKWYQQHVYRAVFVGSVLLACILVGVVVGLLVRPSGNVNPSPTPVEPVAPPLTPAPTINSASEQIACDFIAQTSLSECRLQRTVVQKKGLTIPSEIGLLTKLTYLSLENSGLTGSIPESIGSLTELRHLSFRFNAALMGSIPSTIGNLVLLTKLDFGITGLQGSIPSSIGSLTQIQILDFYFNKFAGGIPMSVGNLTQLSHVSFAANQLTGSIPLSIESLAQLTYLDFGYNQLNGTVPISIGALTKLTLLGMYRNEFTGNIPSSIENLTQMMQLHWDNCKFTGTIPPTIGLLTHLEGLNFGANVLTGGIPSSIANLTALKYLSLGLTELTGSIPSTLCPLVTDFIFIDCGEILCDCCKASTSSTEDPIACSQK